jgi:hypothetical protein
MEMSLQTDDRENAGGLVASYAIWAGLFLFLTLPVLVVAYETAVHFSGVAIDGPFQLYDALRRIQGGFRPGVDFQYFHGLGIPYLHYGLYRLFGGGLFGSELARELVAAAVYPAVFLIFFRAFTRSWRTSLCLTAAALAASFALKLSAMLFAVNGMLAVRSTIPALVPVVLYVVRGAARRTIAVGVTLGLALFLSTEQGLAVVIAYVVVSALAIVRRSASGRQVVESALSVGIAGLTLVLCLITIGGWQGMTGALRYNFLSVPRDQFWFFGSPPNTFVPSWRSGFVMAWHVRLIGGGLLFGTIATAICLRRFWLVPEDDRGRRHFALGVLPVYGLISCASLLGVFTPAYVQPLWRSLLLLAGVALSEVATSDGSHPLPREWLGVPRVMAATAFALVAWVTASTRLISTALFVSVPHVVADHLIGHQRRSIEGIWPKTLADGQRMIDARRDSAGRPPTLWSTYAGWIEARNGLFHPSFDYIIHALGPQYRTAYVDKFRAARPRLVQTVDPGYTQYEAWLENNDWTFYDELLDWYTVVGTTPWSIYWERRERPAAQPEQLAMMRVPAELAAVQLPRISDTTSSGVTLVEVDIEYETHNPLHWLPIIGPSPRYLIGIEGALSHTPISLNPFVSRARFPVLVAAGQRPTLHFETASLLPGVSWRPRTLRLDVRWVDPRNQPWLSSLVRQLSGGAK